MNTWGKYRTAAGVLAAVLIFCGPFGCASARKTAAPPNLKLDALHIEVDPSGNLPPKFWDSYILMEKGNALFRAKNFAEAAPFYQKVLDEYPDSEAYPLALYNLAACSEKTGDYAKALGFYNVLESRHGPTIEIKELRMRQATCLEELERWREAAEVLKKLAEMFSLTTIERIDANIRLGIAYYFDKNYEFAKQALYAGLSDYKTMAQTQLPIDTFYVAKGYFYLGEIFFDRYIQIKLDGQGAELRSQLEAKADLFIMARAQYLRCLQTYQAVWMSASLFKLGYGYETFYFAMKSAAVPDGLTQEQIDEYNKKLADRINNVLSKAIDAYSRNIDLAREFDLHVEWVEKSRQRFEYLTNYKKENGL